MRTAVIAVTAVVQFLLHYLSLAAAIFAALALFAGNFGRAGELAASAVGLFVLKFLVGFAVVTTIGLGQPKPENAEGARP